MFNPYIEPNIPEPTAKKNQSAMGGIFDKLKSLDQDDLLMLALIFILARKNSKEDIWPLVAVIIYCMLGN